MLSSQVEIYVEDSVSKHRPKLFGESSAGSSYIVKITRPRLQDKHIKSAQRALKRYIFTTPQLVPFWYRNRPMQAGQDRIAVVSLILSV